MAVEIRQSKQLHRHALLVVGLLIGFFALSAVTLNFQLNNRDKYVILNTLTKNALHVKYDDGGLVKIHVQKAEPPQLSEISNAGRSADLSFSLQ